LAHKQATLLHAVQQLADIAFRNQQPVGQFLLGDAFGAAEACQYIELSDAQPSAAQMIGREPIDLLKDAHKPEPCQNGWAPGVRGV
jgi:hypothetical protein